MENEKDLLKNSSDNGSDCCCDCGSECNCGPDCKCECNCGPDCDCECQSNNQEKQENSNQDKDSCCLTDSASCCSVKSFLNIRNLLGLFLLFLGIFYLGKNLGWWSLGIAWSIIWPIIFIFLGVKIIRWGK